MLLGWHDRAPATRNTAALVCDYLQYLDGEAHAGRLEYPSIEVPTQDVRQLSDVTASQAVATHEGLEQCCGFLDLLLLPVDAEQEVDDIVQNRNVMTLNLPITVPKQDGAIPVAPVYCRQLTQQSYLGYSSPTFRSFSSWRAWANRICMISGLTTRPSCRFSSWSLLSIRTNRRSLTLSVSVSCLIICNIMHLIYRVTYSVIFLTPMILVNLLLFTALSESATIFCSSNDIS
jgi:hypothetical protein